MDIPPDLIGRLGLLLLLTCLALTFLVKGVQARQRSLRFANLALFCGLAVFVMPEKAFSLSSTDHWTLFLIIGALRVLLGVVGIALAITAIVKRRDGGVGISRPF